MKYEEKLKELLLQSGLSQADLASILDVSRPTITFWLNGKHKPSGFHLKQLSQFFDIKISWFHDNSQDYPPSPEYLLNENISSSKENNHAIRSLLNIDAIKQSDRTGNCEFITNDQKHVQDNLFLIDHPDIKSILLEIEKSIVDGNSGKIPALVNRLKKLLQSTFLNNQNLNYRNSKIIDISRKGIKK